MIPTMLTPTILLCPPYYFRVESSINIWMKKSNSPVDPALAQKQWLFLKNTLASLLSIEIIQAQKATPDMVFTANAGFVFKSNIILSNFLHPERKGETAYFKKKFETLGYNAHSVPEPLSFEGCGDALYDEHYRIIWGGHGFRSSPEVYPFVKELTETDYLPLTLVEEAFYHLDTCLCPLPDGQLLYYPAAFDRASLGRIEEIVPEEKRIPVSDADAYSFVCNAVSIENTVLCNAISDTLRKTLEERGLQIILTPLSEFIKSGGAIKCLSLRLDVPSAKNA